MIINYKKEKKYFAFKVPDHFISHLKWKEGNSIFILAEEYEDITGLFMLKEKEEGHELILSENNLLYIPHKIMNALDWTQRTGLILSKTYKKDGHTGLFLFKKEE